MADETILFQVTDGGSTAAFTNLLDKLGEVGDQAFNKLGAQVGRFEQGSEAASAAIKLMATYIASAGENAGSIEAVGAAFQTLTAEQIEAAAASETVIAALQGLGVAEQAVALEARNAAAAIVEMEAAVAAAAEANVKATQILGEYVTVENLAALAAREAAIEEEAAALAYSRSTEAKVAASAATKEAASSYTSATGALRGMTGGFVGLLAQIGLFISVSSIVKDIDAYSTLHAQLTAVSASGTEADAVFNKLLATANATQTPIKTIVNTYDQFRASLDTTKYSGDQVSSMVDTLSKLLRGSGTDAAATTRILHDLSEGLGTGTLQGKQLNSVFQQNSVFAKELGDALGVNLHSFQEHTAASGQATASVSKFGAAADSSIPSVKAAASSVTEHTNAVNGLKNSLNSADSSLVTAQTSHNNVTAAVNNDTKAYDTYTAGIGKANQGLATAKTNLANARIEQDQETQAKQRATSASAAHTSGLSAETLAMGLLSQHAQDVANSLNSAFSGTISGAITNVNNSLIAFLGSTGLANAAVNITKGILNELAANLGTVAEVVGTAATAFAAWKIAEVSVALVTFAARLVTCDAAMIAFNLAMTPEIALFVAIAAAIAIAAGKYGLLKPLLDTVTDAWKNLTTSHDNTTTSLKKETAEQDANTKSLIANSNAVAANNSLLAHRPGNTVKQLQQQDPTGGDAGPGATTTPSGGSGSGGPLVIAGGGSSGSGGTSGLTVVAGPSRNGSDFTVPGASGVDSRLIAVSPGEHVTVQTAMQSKEGTINDVVPHYRNGGTFGAGVNLGLGNVVVQFIQALTASLTGFAATKGYTTSTLDSSAASSGSTSAANDNSSSASAAPLAAASTSSSVSANTTQTQNIQTQNVLLGPGFQTFGGLPGGNEVDTSTAATLSKSQQDTIDRNNAANTQADKKLTSYNGVSVPPDNGGLPQVVSPEQARTFVYEVGSGWHTRDSPPLASRNPVYARNGVDFTVPGGSGVDSRAIQMAVSPGEQVSVTTPAQQRGTDNGNGQQVVNLNMTVVTPDANSFGKSSSQILAQQKQKLARLRA